MSILKKIFFLSSFFLGLSLLFWGVYVISFKKSVDNSVKKDTASTTQKSPTDNVQPTIEKIAPISKEAISYPTLSSGNDTILFFSKKTGQIAQMDFYGENEKTISSENVPDLTDAKWSVDKQKVIMQTKNSKGEVAFSTYDLVSKTNIPLKNNLDQAVWQTNTNRILYKYYEAKTKTRTLNVSDADGNNWDKLADLDYPNISIAQIPKTGLVSFWNTGDAYAQTNFQSMPLVGGESTHIDTKDFGADYLWNDAGDWVLVSHADAKEGSRMDLGVMNMNGGEYRNLGIPTFITKCVWSKDGKTIFYSLPGKIPDNSVLPNDYREGKFQTTDTFWKVNTQTGEKTRLVELKDMTDQYDASELFLNQSESLLFFVNKVDGKLYKITL